MIPHKIFLPTQRRISLCLCHSRCSSQRNISDISIKELGKSIGINKVEDWYNITASQVRGLQGGAAVLDRYNGSLINALKSAYPDYPWKEYMFKKLPYNYWDSMENQRKLMDDLGLEFGFTKLDDWTNLPVKKLKEEASAVLAKYNYSLYQVLEAIYPEHPWKPWLFQNLPRTYWDNKANVMKFLNWFAEQNNITKMEDWYRVTTSTVKKFGGNGILTRYGYTMYSLLSEIYPKFEWKAWLFRGTVPNGFWNSVDNQRKYLLWLADQLSITTTEDWKKLTWKDITQRRGFQILCMHDFSLLKLFSTVFPETNWTSVFGSHHMMSRQKTQQHLIRLLNRLFPDEDILVNYRHPQLKFKESGRTMEFDAFLEDINLAFEYQGEHHYKNTSMNELPTSVFQERDNEKMIKAKELGITIVEIPFWWDKTKASLVSMILTKRPDLQSVLPQVEKTDEPLSAQPEEVDGSIQLLLAQTYQDHIDPTDWWMSEKYDGIRAYWDGKQFISRNSRPLKIPQHIVQQMPSETLDGEIWFGHNTARESMQVVKKSKTVPWDKFKFMIFDAPLRDGVFEDRMACLNNLVPTGHSFLEVVPMVRCQGRQHLEEFYQALLKKSSEGVMLRKPGSSYTSGRSSNLLKLKPYRDGEGVISVAAKHGDGVHFECKLPNGVTFPCWVNASLQPSVKVGSVVTFQCSGYFINGRPRKPWITTLREDLTVDDVLIDSFHYWVEMPALPTQTECYCCKKPLGSIRIQVKGLQESGNNITREMKVGLCPSMDCLNLASAQSRSLPEFQKVIVIPTFTRSSVEEDVQLFDLKGVKIINSHRFVSK